VRSLILFFDDSAQEMAHSKSHKTIAASDVLKALEAVELGDMVGTLQRELDGTRSNFVVILEGVSHAIFASFHLLPVFRAEQKANRGKGRASNASNAGAANTSISESADYGTYPLGMGSPCTDLDRFIS
jgi:hypothetical protein